jgi:hypothetical protein
VSSAWNSTFGNGRFRSLTTFAAALLEPFGEALRRLGAGGVVPGDRHRPLDALLAGDDAHRVARLPVRERAAHDVRAAHRPGDRVGAGVRDDEQGVVVLRGLGHRQRDAGVHGADEDIDVVALDQLVDVVGRLRRLGLVVDLEVLHLTAGELAALFLDVELEAVLDRVAERGVGAAVGEHEADLDRAARALREGRAGEKGGDAGAGSDSKKLHGSGSRCK